MKSIITTYPDFHALPKGIKRMLLASESFFFAEAYSQLNQNQPATGSRLKQPLGAQPSNRVDTPLSIFGSSWKN
jgi:hypothetical protein